MQAGWVEITLGGASYSMRPTYGAIRDIEARTNMTMQELLELVVAQRLKMEEAVLIVWYGCQSAGADFDGIDALGRVVFEERITSESLRSALAQFILNALYSPKEAQEKWEAEVAPMITSDATG